jgi:hypothetical protein
MASLFYILLFMALYHFFYECIFANSLRHDLRYKFFKLRDDLRDLKIDGLNKEDEKVYDFLDQAVCNVINSMSFISIENYLKLKHFINNNEHVKKSIKRNRLMIELCENQKLKDIDERINSLGARVLLINNGSWFIYLVVPFILFTLVLTLNRKFSQIGIKLNKMSNRLIYSSDRFENTNGMEVV